MQAIRIHETGGPEVLRVESIAEPVLGAGDILIRHRAIGVNFIDTYHRTGLYPVSLPSGIGMEAAGIVEAVADGVTNFKVGDHAAYCSGPIGAYAEANVVAASRAVRLPQSVSFDVAAAVLLKGMTARFLLKKTYPVQRGDTVVIHAAAGGVGQLLVQWAKHLGATVIAVVGSEEKAAIVRKLGADHLINSREQDIAKTVRELTNGEGVPVVYDSVGKDTFEASLNSLRPLGMFVSYGNASGPAPPVDPRLLNAKGSLFFTRPGLFHYVRTPALLQETADDLFDALKRGIVKVEINQRWPLAQAGDAHRALEARATTGATLLDP